MISYNRFVLDNGLRVLVHEDATTPMAVVNILYDVGARDEDPNKTGFAHLFEHLMFGGSINIPDYDGPLQRAGGEKARHHAQPQRPARYEPREQRGRRRVGRRHAGQIGATGAHRGGLRVERPVRRALEASGLRPDPEADER